MARYPACMGDLEVLYFSYPPGGGFGNVFVGCGLSASRRSKSMTAVPFGGPDDDAVVVVVVEDDRFGNDAGFIIFE